jgi:uncharacterized membrane protein YbhN (UPF0104 family)
VSTPRRRWWFLQLIASVLVLGALIREVEPGQLATIPQRLHVGWMLAAIAMQVFALTFHEVRTWLALPVPRPALSRVTLLGLAAGILNLILPARAGDLAVVVLLRRLCGVRTGIAAAAMGIVSFLEAAVFGVVLLVVLLLGAAQWESIVGPDALARATRFVSLGTGGAVAAAAVITLIGRLLARPDEAPPEGPGLLTLLREAMTETGAALSSPRYVVLNTAAALVQVLAIVAAFAMALPAVGIDVAMPGLAASGVLALSSLAAIALPPGYGAGPAAAAAAVLPVFGVDAAGVLAYAGAWWILSQIPATAIGIPCMLALDLKPRELAGRLSEHP